VFTTGNHGAAAYDALAHRLAHQEEMPCKSAFSDRASKPVRCGSPTLGRFDSYAAPLKNCLQICISVAISSSSSATEYEVGTGFGTGFSAPERTSRL
jgi:hypothetical protein